MEIPLKKREKSTIEIVIELSKLVIKLKLGLHRARQVHLYLLSLPLIFHDIDYLNHVVNDIQYKINVTEDRIKFYLKTLFGKDEYFYATNKHSFSIQEMKDGYATIYKVIERDKQNKVTKGIDCALLLSGYKNEVLDLCPGTIISFEGHKDVVLKNLKPVISEEEINSFTDPKYSIMESGFKHIPKSN